MSREPRSPRRSSAGGDASLGPRPRKLLLSAAGPAMAPLLELSARTFRAYARRHGYRLELHDLHDDRDRSSAAVRAAKWRKVALLRSALDRAEVVLWLDADTVVRRFDRDVADELPRSSFQGLALEHFPDRWNPNTGVWVLRGGPAASAFLDEVVQTGQLPHSWADQATVCQLLGWDLGDHHGHGARPRRHSAHRAGTCWLDPTWNHVGAHDRSARIRHYAGQPLSERRARMERAVRRLAARGELEA